MLKRNIAIAALMAALTGISGVVLADNKAEGSGPPGPNPEMFQKMKAKMLENHQKRVQIMQSAESCIQAATAPDQLKSCHEQERQAGQQLQQQNRQERDTWRKERQDQGSRK